jgi:hypothetical protein
MSFIELESSINGQKVNVQPNSILHKHLRQHDNGQTWKFVSKKNTRTSAVSVGVDIKNGQIVRPGQSDTGTGKLPRHAQGVKPGVQSPTDENKAIENGAGDMDQSGANA